MKRLPKLPQHWQFFIYSKLHVSGITLFPFIILQSKALLQDKTFVNHEHIHLRQQLEMLILPFYLFYLIHYGINLLKYKNHDTAYRNIVFEKEAYQNEDKLDYLAKRPLFNWLRYL